MWIERNLPGDPNILPFIGTPLGALPTGITPGSSPGVTVGITTDSYFTYPFNGNKLPVYDVNIVNTGNATDTFNLSPSDTSGQFHVWTSVPSLTLLPGQAGETNLCILPGDSTGVTVPPINSTGQLPGHRYQPVEPRHCHQHHQFHRPRHPHGSHYGRSARPHRHPWRPRQRKLDSHVRGQRQPRLRRSDRHGRPWHRHHRPYHTYQHLSPQRSHRPPVVFTTAANDTANLYHVVVSATYTTATGPQTASFAVPITVQSLGACSLSAALAARQTGAISLGNTLATLATDLNAAAALPPNSAYVSRIAGDLSVINYGLSNITYLQALAGTIASDGNAVSTASSPANLLTALGNLDGDMCTIANILDQASKYNTQIYLSPSTQVTGPNLGATYTVSLSNPSNTTKVYNLSVMGVPDGITAQFNSTSVTLGPTGQYTSYSSSYGLTPITLTLTPGASFITPFTFNVVATPVGASQLAISVPGSLMVRAQSISIDNVTSSPTNGAAGTKFAVTARVFAEVNQDITATLQMTVTNSSGQQIGGQPQSDQFTLSPTSTFQTITFPAIDSTGFADGAYTISIQAFDVSKNGPIQGASSSGTFVVGAVLGATLTANGGNPIAPGKSAVPVSLAITRDTTVSNPVSTLLGSVALKGISRSMTLYTNPQNQHQLAYACSDSWVNIVDVNNPSSPQIVGSFANDVLTNDSGQAVQGFEAVACAVSNTTFILSYSRAEGNTGSGNVSTYFAMYDLSPNPLAPTAIGSVVSIPRNDSSGLYVSGTTALVYQSTVNYNQNNVIVGESGDVWTADISGASSGTINYLNDVYSCGGINSSTNHCNNTTTIPSFTNGSGVCTPNGNLTVPNDPNNGGPFQINSGAVVNSTTSYFASTNAYEYGNFEDPACPQIVGESG